MSLFIRRKLAFLKFYINSVNAVKSIISHSLSIDIHPAPPLICMINKLFAFLHSVNNWLSPHQCTIVLNFTSWKQCFKYVTCFQGDLPYIDAKHEMFIPFERDSQVFEKEFGREIKRSGQIGDRTDWSLKIQEKLGLHKF